MKKEFKTLLIQTEDGVTKVILNRPEIHNAFNDEMITELKGAMEDFSKDPNTRVVLLTGAGNSFCAGADLHWMKEIAGYSSQENIADAIRFHEMLMTVYHCAKPVVAYVNGAAIGGGTGLVAAADMAYAHEEAKFGFSEVRLGLIPAVVSPFVIRKIGERNVREYFLTGEKFSAKQACQMGLVQGVGSPEDIKEILAKKIKSLKCGGPEALSECKKLIHEISGVPLENVGGETARKIAERRASEEAKEGMSAFLSKTKPKWFSPFSTD